MTSLKRTIFLIALFVLAGVSACARASDQNDASSPHDNYLKHSFALRQGRHSAVTAMDAGTQGYIYAAGFSHENCVVLKLDAELKTLVKMVRFGSSQGGSYFSQDTITGMAIDSQSNIFVVGHTKHDDFPATPGCYDSTKEGEEAFVTKFSSDLDLMASTFIGGKFNDRAHAIAIDRQDNIYVTGYSGGCDPENHQCFSPPPGGWDRAPAPLWQSKAFVAKLNNDLTALRAATFLGGNEEKNKSDDIAFGIALDRAGNVWVAGQTRSMDFPVTPGCIGGQLVGDSDIFVSKFDANLKTLMASTYLGGRKNERANAIVADAKGNVFVGGWSESSDMLVFLEGYDSRHSLNEEDAFVVKLDAHLKHLSAGTFIGGEGPSPAQGGNKIYPGDDHLTCMRLSDDGQTLYVAGRTESRDFDTTPPSRITHYGNMVLNVILDRNPALEKGVDMDYGDGFIARFDTDLTTRFSSMLFGGSSLDYIDDIVLHGQDLYLAGETHSVDFPGMAVHYGIGATRGFISRLGKEGMGDFSEKRPVPFKPQLTDAKIKKIAGKLMDGITKCYVDEDFYSELGRYAKARISRDQFESKIRRELFIYGKPFLLGLKFHHYNYTQNGKDGYDWIELCYKEVNPPSSYIAPIGTVGNPVGGRFVLTIIVKNEKWQLVGIEYRGFSNETGKNVMKKRLR